MTLLELSLIAALSQNTLWPSLTLEQSKGPVFYRIQNAAKCSPTEWKRWNPISASWDVSIGLKLSPFELSLGHKSEHSVGSNDHGVESFDYVGLKYKVEL